jgi:hypothetical protein
MILFGKGECLIDPCLLGSLLGWDSVTDDPANKSWIILFGWDTVLDDPVWLWHCPRCPCLNTLDTVHDDPAWLGHSQMILFGWDTVSDVPAWTLWTLSMMTLLGWDTVPDVPAWTLIGWDTPRWFCLVGTCSWILSCPCGKTGMVSDTERSLNGR